MDQEITRLNGEITRIQTELDSANQKVTELQEKIAALEEKYWMFFVDTIDFLFSQEINNVRYDRIEIKSGEDSEAKIKQIINDVFEAVKANDFIKKHGDANDVKLNLKITNNSDQITITYSFSQDDYHSIEKTRIFNIIDFDNLTEREKLLLKVS